MRIRDTISIGARHVVHAMLLAVAFAAQAHAQPVVIENARYNLARGYEDAGDLQNAARVYRELYDSDSHSETYFEAVRRTYLALLKYADLTPLVEHRVKSRSKDIALRVLYADLLSRTKRPDEAKSEWANAIALNPDDPVVYGLVGKSQTDNREFELAIRTYVDGRERMLSRARASGTVFAEALAQLYGILGRFSEASNEYLDLLTEQYGQLVAVQSGMASFIANPKGSDAAIDATEKRLQNKPSDAPFLELLSWLYAERNDEDGALRTAKRLDDIRRSNGSSIYAFADRAMREARYESALKALDFFLKSYPENNPLYVSALGSYAETLDLRYRSQSTRGKITHEQATELKERYEKIIATYPKASFAPDVMLHLARILGDDLFETDEALDVLTRLVREYPSSFAAADAVLYMGDLYTRNDQLTKAIDTYRAAINPAVTTRNSHLTSERAELRLAELMFMMGRFDESSTLFEKFTNNVRSESTNDALEYLFVMQENLKKNDSALAHYARGRLKMFQRKFKDAIPELEAAAESGAQTGLADDALLGKARAEEELGKNEAAIATLIDLAAKFPKGTAADKALFNAAELTASVLRDTSGAQALYMRILTEYPNSPYVAPARERVRAIRAN